MPETDIRCPTCASSVLRRVYDHAFAIEWKCVDCVKPFFTPLLSVTLLDSNGERRTTLAAAIETAGIRTVAAERLNELEQLPADASVIADLEMAATFASKIPHGVPLIVLVDSAAERTEAIERTDGRGIVVNGTPAAVLRLLKTIAKVKAAAVSMPSPITNRRHGARERRRTTRRDRRS